MATKDPVINDMTISKILEWQKSLQSLERNGAPTISIPLPEFRNILNYIFDLEQDLRWNTSKWGVVPPMGENESDGRIF